MSIIADYKQRLETLSMITKKPFTSNTTNPYDYPHCDAYGFSYRPTPSPTNFTEKDCEFILLREFINQSLKETEISIALAQKNNDEDQYNWYCGFAEALGEVLANIEEMESHE